jgi:hypothetical protein
VNRPVLDGDGFRCTLCMIHSRYVHSGLAAWYLAAAVKRARPEGTVCEVVEATVNQPAADILKRMVLSQPQVLAFCCYIWNIETVIKISRLVKDALPTVKIVLGGPEVWHRAEGVIADNPLVDVVLAGEGEASFPLLLDALCLGKQPESVPGACFKTGEKIVCLPPNRPQGQPPDPYSAEYFKALAGRIAYIEGSRGCPYSCAFCLSGSGGSVRYFPMERVKRDIIRLANSGSATIKFVDRTFNADPARAREIFKFIMDAAENGMFSEKVCFHFEVAGDILDEKTFGLLAAAPAGLFQFEAGIQSLNGAVLEHARRRTDINRLMGNLQRLIALDSIHIHVDLIAGLSLEGIDSFASGFDQVFALRPHMLQLGFLKLLYGAEMRSLPERYPCRFDTKPPYEVEETPWLNPPEMAKIKACSAALDRLYNKGRFFRTLGWLVGLRQGKAFEIFFGIGEELEGFIASGVSLNGLIELFYRHATIKLGADPLILRDYIILDCLSTGRHRQVPAMLKGAAPFDKSRKKPVRKSARHRRPKGPVFALWSVDALAGAALEQSQVTKDRPVIIAADNEAALAEARAAYSSLLGFDRIEKLSL